MPTIPRFNLDLGRRPRIAQAGLCLHGSRAAESFCLHGLWSLHAYHYRGEIRVQGNTFPFRAGWVSLIPPDLLVEWHFPSHAPHHYVHFAVETAGEPSLISLPLLQDLGKDFDGFCASFEQMIQYQGQDPQRAFVRLWDLLHQLRRESGTSPTHAPLHPSVQIALSLIRDRQSENVRIGKIAQAMGVSHNHLTNAFKQAYGCGVQQYIQRERLNRACHLLAHSSLAIKSIAIETGFPDLQHFNKRIRAATGFSPRDYRNAGAKRQPHAFNRALTAPKSTGTSNGPRAVR